MTPCLSTDQLRAPAEFADDHDERHGHYPTRVHIHEADVRALRLVGARR